MGSHHFPIEFRGAVDQSLSAIDRSGMITLRQGFERNGDISTAARGLVVAYSRHQSTFRKNPTCARRRSNPR
jgi:hypothetical protein